LDVVIVSSVLPIEGNVASFVDVLTKKLRKTGDKTVVVNIVGVRNPDFNLVGSFSKTLISYLLKFDFLFLLFFVFARLVLRLRIYLRFSKNKPQIIHAQDINAYNAISRFCRKRKIPLFLNVHGNLYNGETATRSIGVTSWLSKYLFNQEIKAYKDSQYIITVSDSLFELVSKYARRGVVHNIILPESTRFISRNNFHNDMVFDRIISLYIKNINKAVNNGKIILTVDLEDWFQTHDYNIDSKYWGNYQNRVEIGTSKLLQLFSKYNVKATFFILGYIAKNNPLLIKRITEEGHEIATHGMWHRNINKLTKEEFRSDILESKKIIEEISGKQVVFFRAPTWSISEENLWALEVLEEEGFVCDSSLQPFVTPFSGMITSPNLLFHPVVNENKLKLKEFPQTLFLFGKIPVPFSGGFYFRFMPYPIIRFLFRYISTRRTAMFYIHPWELDYLQPRLPASMFARFIHYYNLKYTFSKLDKLLSDFDFMTLGEAIKDENCYEVKLKKRNRRI